MADFKKTMKAIDVRAQAIDLRITQNRMINADDGGNKLVNKHLRKRQQQINAQADFLSKIADWYAMRR